MPIVDGRPSGRKPVTPEEVAAMPDGPIKSLLLTAPPPKHDWPACAIFRGGKCTCDQDEPLDGVPGDGHCGRVGAPCECNPEAMRGCVSWIPHGVRGAPAPTLPDGREEAMVVVERDETGRPTVWCDPEIVDLVRALNAGGVRTIASCSGHGERPGWIALKDGRQLAIVPDLDSFKRLIGDGVANTPS